MEKAAAVKRLEVRVKRNQSAARGDGEGCEIGIRPEPMTKSGLTEKRRTFFIEASGFLKKPHA